MTAQEQQMIDGLIDRIRNTQVTDRDPIAADHLQRGLGGNPDALYILAQTVLVQQQALLQAQQQLQSTDNDLAQLRQQAGQAQPPQQQSWLDRFFGSSQTQQQQPAQPSYSSQQNPYGSQPSYPSAQPPQTYGTPVYGGTPQPYPQQNYPPQPYPGGGYPPPPAYGYSQPSGSGSFLRSAATTAAGVAAGALLFEGVESMFSGHHHNDYAYGSGHEGGTTINNYYEDKPEHHADAGSTAGDGSFYNPSHDASRSDLNSEVNNAASSHQPLSSDIEDRRFADTANNDDTFADDYTGNAFVDDTSSDDNGFDDNSSFDDSGDFDSGGGNDDN